MRAGDTEQAKSLYAAARVPWEAIEPVAELFPDSDAVIDSRADDYDQAEADPNFSGFHALEYGLWSQGTINGATVDLPALADRLDSDIAALITSVQGITIQPQVMTNGAGALIEEASQGKITGEEDRYSKTDLTTLAANIDGSQEIFDLLKPLITTANAAAGHGPAGVVRQGRRDPRQVPAARRHVHRRTTRCPRPTSTR